MDFAALLIVIELDDFLMCYPGQLYARKHFGDDFLQHEFSDQEVQQLIKIKHFGQHPTCLNFFTRLFEKMIKNLSRNFVFVIVILVNLEFLESFDTAHFKSAPQCLLEMNCTSMENGTDAQ